VAKVKRLVFANTAPDYFITLFAAIFDPGTGTLEWVNAGHNPPFLRRASGEMTMLHDGGLLLGVSREAVYVSGRTVLDPGDILVMYTDGLTEAMDGSGEEYGERRLAGMVEGACGDGPCAIVSAVVEDVGRFHGGNEFGDDFTMMVARRL
jgi:sigma-B regulation protein RsbU (phosphoserine phosphatase)